MAELLVIPQWYYIHDICGDSVKIRSHVTLRWGKFKYTETMQVTQDIQQPNIDSTAIIVKKKGRPKKLPQETVTMQVEIEVDTVYAWMWQDAVETCLIGFVSNPFIAACGKALDGCTAEITELLSDSPWECYRNRSEEGSA